MTRILSIVLLLLGGIVPSFAQNQVITRPYNVTSGNNLSSTIAVTNTFQSIIAADTSQTGRTACTIVNYGSNTMWVYFGAIAGATKAKSIQLAVGQAVYCNVGGTVLRDQISITGTATEAYYAVIQ